MSVQSFHITQDQAEYLKNYFTDPVSFELTDGLVLYPCGHSLNRSVIQDIVNRIIPNTQGQKPAPLCPTCREPIRRYVKSYALYGAANAVGVLFPETNPNCNNQNSPIPPIQNRGVSQPNLNRSNNNNRSENAPPLAPRIQVVEKSSLKTTLILAIVLIAGAAGAVYMSTSKKVRAKTVDDNRSWKAILWDGVPAPAPELDWYDDNIELKMQRVFLTIFGGIAITLTILSVAHLYKKYYARPQNS